MEFHKGYMQHFKTTEIRYQSGYTQMQILYIGYHIYRWLTDREQDKGDKIIWQSFSDYMKEIENKCKTFNQIISWIKR